MKARDAMHPDYDAIRPDDPLKKAIKLLSAAGRGEENMGPKGLPVIDANGKLVGLLSMRDILRSLMPPYMGMANLGAFSWDGMVEEVARNFGDRRVDEMMSKAVIKVSEDATLMECVDRMVKHSIKRLPVVDGEGKVTGMLYERDLFFAVTKAMLE